MATDSRGSSLDSDPFKQSIARQAQLLCAFDPDCCIAMASDKSFLAIGNHRKLMIVNPHDFIPSKVMEVNTRTVYASIEKIIIDSDDRGVWTLTSKEIVRWDACDNFKPTYVLKSDEIISSMFLVGDDLYVIGVSSIRVFAALSAEPKIHRNFKHLNLQILGMINNNMFVSTLQDGSLGLHDWETGSLIRKLDSNDRIRTAYAFSHDKPMLAVTYDNCSLNVWDVSSEHGNEPVLSEKTCDDGCPRSSRVDHLEFFNGQSRLYSITKSGVITLYDVKKGGSSQELSTVLPSWWTVQLSSDEMHLHVVTSDPRDPFQKVQIQAPKAYLTLIWSRRRRSMAAQLDQQLFGKLMEFVYHKPAPCYLPKRNSFKMSLR